MTEYYGYKVNINSTLLSESRSEEEYGEWSESFSNDFIKITKSNKYPDIVSTFDIKVGQKAYLVWLEYTTGDSFGWSDRGNTEAIGVFLNKESAQELVKELEKTVYNRREAREDGYSFYFKTKDGQEFKYGNMPWYGFFERLDEVHLEEVIIEKKVTQLIEDNYV